jgi:asparagine synthetase B (glutamine-hydrolysing)
MLHLLDRWSSRPRAFVTGDAADGLFGDSGYRRFARVRALSRIPGRKVLGRFAEAMGGGSRRGAGLSRLLGSDPSDFRLFVPEVFAHAHVERLLGFDPTADVQSHFDAIAREIPDATPAQRYTYLYLRVGAQGYIDKLERLTAAAGADLVHPFLFPEVVELAMRLPARMRNRGELNKPVVLQLALRTAPHEQIFGEKMGFGAPRHAWLREDPSLRDLLATLAGPDSALGAVLDRGWCAQAVRELDRPGGGGYADSLWILASAELWARAFLRG